MKYSTILLVLLWSFSTNAQSSKIESVVQFGHLGAEIREMVIAADGSMMATTDGIIVKLWDLKTGLEIRSLAEENRPAASIAHIGLSADGNTVGYLYDGTAVLRRTEDGSDIRLYPNLPDSTDNKELTEENYNAQAEKQRNKEICYGLTFHPLQNLVALSFSGRVEIHHIITDHIEYSIPLKSDSPKYQISGQNLRFSPDGNFLMSGTQGVSLSGDRILNYSPPEIQRDSTKDYRFAGSLMTTDRNFLITAYSTAEKFDSIQNRLNKEWEKKISKDSTALDNEAEVNREEGKVYLPFFTMHSAYQEQEKSFAKTGTIVITDASTGLVLHQIDTTGVSFVCLSPDNQKIATTHPNGWISFWDIATGKGLSRIKIEQKVEKNPFFETMPPRPKLLFTPDSKSVIVAAKFVEEENIAIWDISTGQKVRSIGADIPLVNIDVTKVTSKNVDMREYVEFSSTMFLYPYKYEVDRGYRMFDLAKGKVPAAFPRYDSVFYSPKRDYYLLQKSGNRAEVYNTELNDRICFLKGDVVQLRNVCFSHDGKLVAASYKNKFMLWDAQTGELTVSNSRHQLPIVHLSFDPKGSFLISCGEDDRVGFWEVANAGADEPKAKIGLDFKMNFIQETFHNRDTLIKKGGNILKNINNTIEDFSTFRIPGKDNSPVSTVLEKSGKGLDITSRISKKINRAEGLLKFKGGYDITYSEDGRYAAVWINNYCSVKVFDLEVVGENNPKEKTSKLERLKEKTGISNKNGPKKIGDINDYYLMGLQKYVFGGRKNDKPVSPQDSSYLVYMMVNNFKKQYNLKNISAFSPDYQRIASYRTTFSIAGSGRGLKGLQNSKVESKKGIRIQQIGVKKSELWLPESEGYNEGLALTGSFIAASNRTTNTIKVWNVITGEFIKSIPGHSGKLRFSPNGKYLFSSGWDRQVKAFDFATGKERFSFIGIKGTNDYIIILPNGYYTASRRNSKAVAFAKGRRAYPFEQFDILFNRPDSLLEKFGDTYAEDGGLNPNAELTKAYLEAYNKRLENLGYKLEDLSADVHLPELSIGKVPVSTTSPKLSITIKAEDVLFTLDRLQIYVNDVPLFGTRGIDLKKANKKAYEGTHEIGLLPGTNKIQVSVYNIKGVESLRETARIECTATPIKPKLYLVMAGVSNFRDTALNLGSPINDLKAVLDLFNVKNAEYDIIPITLYDSEFTRDNFRALKTRLQNTAIQDRIIMMVATHGLLDAKYNYYLATYDTDFKNPSSTALPYRDIESFFDGIKARQRLVLLDACHAGELDTTTLQDFKKTANATPGLKFRRNYPASVWNKVGYQESFDLMKDLFIDLRRGSGATIIGSARGAELAFDGGNGGISVFTYALIKGLKDGNADQAPFDNKIKVSELQEYLGKKVQLLTAGAQRPIYRVENVSNDWRVW
jgi:WD40 repeat protein